MRSVNCTWDSMNSSSLPNLTSLFNSSWLLQTTLWSAYQWQLALWYPLNLLLALSIGAFNFLCFLTICSRQRLRSGTGVLIGHMMLLEGTMGLIAIPIHITFSMVHLQWHLTCQIYQFFFAVVNIAVYFNMLVLAVNRLIAILFPLHYRRFCQPKWLATFVAFIWVSSLIINLPMEFSGGSGHYGVDPVWGGCTPALLRPGQPDYRLVQISLGIYVPLSVSGFLYVVVMYRACLPARRTLVQPAESSRSTAAAGRGQERSHQRKLNMSNLLFFSFLAYCFFFLCYPVVTRSFPGIMGRKPMLYFWMTFLYTGGNAVHSVFLIAMSKAHRQGLHQLLTPCTPRPAGR